MAKKNSTKTATKEALQASEPRVQTFSQWGGMYIKESPYGWTTDYEFERQGHVQNQTDLKPNLLMIQDNVITTSTKSLETRNETQLVSTAPYDDVDGQPVQRKFTGVTCLVENTLYAAFDDGSIRYFNLDDAPHVESQDPSLTRWNPIQITDPDGNQGVWNWTSINYYLGQLICFNINADGVGEIFSGDKTGISSTLFIPRPDTPLTISDNHTGSPMNIYTNNQLYANDSGAYIVVYKGSDTLPNLTNISNLYQNGAIYTLCGYYRDNGDGHSGFYKNAGCTQSFSEAEFHLDGSHRPIAVLPTCGYDLNTGKVYLPYADLTAPQAPYYKMQELGPDLYEVIQLPHRLQFTYTYSNKFGQTEDCPHWTTVYVNISPQVWSQTTGGLLLSGRTPVIDYALTGVDLYYTKDDALDMIFCGHINATDVGTGFVMNPTNSLRPNTTWQYTWYGAYADLSEWSNVSLTVPTENTTKGVDASYMNVHDGRCYFFGGSIPYRLWIGGRVGNELCVAIGVGGGFVDIEPGSGMEINNTHKFKTYNGANIVTIMCGHPNTHQVRRFNLVQTNITLTNELSTSGWMTEEVSNVVGCLSHHGSGVWAQGLYTLSRYGLACTTQQMENSNNLRAQLVSDAIQPIFTESLASSLKNTQMIFVDDIIYFALAKGPQHLNCGLIGHLYNPQEHYYTRDEYHALGGIESDSPNPLSISEPFDQYAMSRIVETCDSVFGLSGSDFPDVFVYDFNVDNPNTLIYIPNSSSYDDRDVVARLIRPETQREQIKQQYQNLGFTYGFVWVGITIHHHAAPGDNQDITSYKILEIGRKFTSFLDLDSTPDISDTHVQEVIENAVYAEMPSDWSGSPSDWLISYTVGTPRWSLEFNRTTFENHVMNGVFVEVLSPELYYKQDEEFVSAALQDLQYNRVYYLVKEREQQFELEDVPDDWTYYSDIYRYYIRETVLDDIIFAYDVNNQAWYTFTYQPNLLDATIDEFGPDTPQDTGYPSTPSKGDIIYCTDNDQYYKYIGSFAGQARVSDSDDIAYRWISDVRPQLVNNFRCIPYSDLQYYKQDVSTNILSLINFDSQASPEGIGIVTTDCIEMIPTAGIVDNAPSYNEHGDIEVPNFVAHIETGELSTASPPQQFHTLSQLEFRFDYFFGDIDIDIEGVDYYGRVFHIHKDVTYDYIQQDLAVYVRVDYIVNTYNIKIKGRAHFRLTHVMAKVYPESRKINLVYGFDDSSLYKKRHGGTQFTHHYIKDYNNLRRALEP